MANQPVIWKKRILVPFWIIRICLMIFIIVAYAWALKVLKDQSDRDYPAIGVVVVFMLLIIAVLLMDILAIILFMRDALNPKSFLIMNCVQTGFWGGVLIVQFVAIGRGQSAVGIGFAVFVFLTFVGLLLYACIGYNRQRKQAQRGHYAPAHNPATPGHNLSQPPPYYGASPYQQNTAYQASPAGEHAPHPQNNPYLPPYQPQGAAADYYTEQPVKPAHIV